MTTRLIIRAVPTRRAWVEYLTARLPHAEVLWDENFANPTMDGRAKSTASYLRALQVSGGDPCIHMEDDIILTRNFLAKVEAVIASRPNQLIQFFSMRNADKTKGSRWDRSFSMNQCFYLPAGYGTLLLDYLPRWHRAHPEHPGGYDLAMNAWLKSRKEAYWLHCPSLVDHRVCQSVADRRRSHHRQSLTFREADL